MDVAELYFNRLVAASRKPASAPDLVLFDPRGAGTTGTRVAYSTAVAPPELLRELPMANLTALRADSANAARARETGLWLKKMHAGTGTSVARHRYLSELRGVPEREISLGAKSTDLEATLAAGESVPLAEAQIVRAFKSVESGEFGGVVLQDLVSDETRGALAAIWKKPSLPEPAFSYEKLVQQLPRLLHAPPLIQKLHATLDDKAQLSDRRRAPAGHAFFTFELLLAIIRGEILPSLDEALPLVAAIGNGEDLNSVPDPSMVGWMRNAGVAIAMVTTEKTVADLKGGQIALVRGADGSIDVTIVESAQAEAVGQKDLFERLGIDVRTDSRRASFNTNLALFNLETLVPRLRRWVTEVGEEAVLEAMTPDLIRNPKMQKDSDGVERRYIQLEGAMGSVLLNLDRAWRKHYSEPLVHFIDVPAANRFELFCPIKTAFDYFLQFHSDRFALNPRNFALEDQGEGNPVQATLESRYGEVAVLIEAFSGSSVRALEKIEMRGPLSLKGVTLAGRVRLVNQTDRTWAPAHGGMTRLENVDIEIDAKGVRNKPWTKAE